MNVLRIDDLNPLNMLDTQTECVDADVYRCIRIDCLAVYNWGTHITNFSRVPFA